LKDVTHTYKLNLSTMCTDRRKEEDAEAETEDANAKRCLENFLANPHSESERPPGYEKAIEEATPDGTVAMIYVVFPEVPRPQPAKEATAICYRPKTWGWATIQACTMLNSSDRDHC
jgi:hypothetical protein